MASAYEIQRRLMARLGALAVLAVAIQAATGLDHLALWLTPLFLLAALLLSGRYVGEEQIHSLRARHATAPRLRPARTVHPRVAVLTLTSLLARTTTLLRGPPAAPLATS